MRRLSVGLTVCALVTISTDTKAFLMPSEDLHLRGYNIKETGLIPRYPAGYACPPLTSLYASWDDVDGSRRTEPHSGVDGGRLGDPILAPGPGIVIAVWETNWGWGAEGSILIQHTREDLGLETGAKYYYSEFDHLQYDEIRSIPEGKRVSRGERIATVSRPGGKRRYLPEVHWEVWEISDTAAIVWDTNRFGGRYWRNKTGRLIDPLYMLAREKLPSETGIVEIPVYEPGANYRSYRGFTYIFRCQKRDRQ